MVIAMAARTGGKGTYDGHSHVDIEGAKGACVKNRIVTKKLKSLRCTRTLPVQRSQTGGWDVGC